MRRQPQDPSIYTIQSIWPFTQGYHGMIPLAPNLQSHTTKSGARHSRVVHTAVSRPVHVHRQGARSGRGTSRSAVLRRKMALFVLRRTALSAYSVVGSVSRRCLVSLPRKALSLGHGSVPRLG